LFALILRIAYFQFIKGSWLKESASRQQTTSRIISANRGIIYDCNGKVLAQSAAVDTISINPASIKDKTMSTLSTSEAKEYKVTLNEKLAQAFSDIFELDYDEVLAKVNSESSVETIIKKVEKDKVDELEQWMSDNEITSGINIDTDYKRYYPYNDLASNLIGFCDTDNNGQEGIELKWNSVLSGTAGKITTITNAASDLIPDKDETYVAAENGSNITLTIDANIQTIVEKYLKQACIENECANGGSAIIMQPSTGDILAMASYPNYDLNNPRTPNSELAETWDTLSSSAQLNALYKMWRNKAVSDTYEPGSTFKIITAAVGLEENVVETDTQNDFLCVGHEIINGVQINCWKNVSTHGYQTLRQALMNSCNPALMQLGKRIGAETLYKYYKAFGLFDKTGIVTSGEANSQFWDLENVGAIELATMSFGQRFTITPIQLITAVSSIANNGVLMQPRIVKQIENTDTGAITTVDTVSVRQVVSEETCEQLIDMLKSVVNDGTGYLGAVQGYTIAGKTGTSEDGVDTSKYVASFIGIAPADNPELVILVALYGPQGANGHQGGTIAAPVVSQILSEVLPYLEIPSDDLTTTTSSNITLPDVRNKTVAEAKKTLENLGLTVVYSGSDTSALVTDQVPKPGTSLLEGSTVVIYSSGNEARISTTVPNLKDMTLSQAKSALKAKNLNIHVTGSGTVVSQDPSSGTTVEEGTVINVTLQQYVTEAH
jgi:stage V sporulation protein D (sporulation-specific penicillin-binding protein)